jgi:phosphatidylglycerophosphate synthase
VWTSGVSGAADFALVIAAFLLLFMWQTPPWLVVVLCAVAGAIVPLLCAFRRCRSAVPADPDQSFRSIPIMVAWVRECAVGCISDLSVQS